MLNMMRLIGITLLVIYLGCACASQSQTDRPQ